jgi:hypothetical protein
MNLMVKEVTFSTTCHLLQREFIILTENTLVSECGRLTCGPSHTQVLVSANYSCKRHLADVNNPMTLRWGEYSELSRRP